ncbi:hypothetical protein F2P81_001294 [Scophthalmus maximus]|uniref:Uncharacterized protein n=1 Tax=Scophthalmus maximus TaxID=52904 RepID=A0A6A4TYU2_SCOMX|nr:hypothetical protein F2P81_001294 [Scophthalmus maximus]
MNGVNALARNTLAAAAENLNASTLTGYYVNSLPAKYNKRRVSGRRTLPTHLRGATAQVQNVLPLSRAVGNKSVQYPQNTPRRKRIQC